MLAIEVDGLDHVFKVGLECVGIGTNGKRFVTNLVNYRRTTNVIAKAPV